MVRRVPTLVFCAIAVVACHGGGDRATLSDSASTANVGLTPADPRSLSDALARASAQSMDSALGGPAWTARELTLEDVERFGAAARRVREIQASDTALRSRMTRHDLRGLPQALEVARAEPQLRNAIEASGLTVDEYFATAASLVQAMMFSSLMREEAGPAQITEVPPGVSKENVEFVLRNEAAVKRALGAAP